MERDYLTVADVLGMHTVYGGALGVRDPGALEAALFRPQTGYYDDLSAAQVRQDFSKEYVRKYSNHCRNRRRKGAITSHQAREHSITPANFKDDTKQCQRFTG